MTIEALESLIRYECPECGHAWHEVWSCACDSECPECGERAIEPAAWDALV